jgi:lipopolysaccharide transport protein LptA
MPASNPNSRFMLMLLVAAPLAAAGAELVPAEGTYAAKADTVTSDFRSNTFELAGNVRVTQGPMFIAADLATGENFGSQNGRMTFRDSVHISTGEADLRASAASAAIVNGSVARARAEGAPAQFEQRGGRSDRQVSGRAAIIEYDFVAGIVKLTNDVWFSNGKDEFRGDVVIYNVRDERLQINPGGQSSGRVRAVIRPRQPDKPQAPPPASESGA